MRAEEATNGYRHDSRRILEDERRRLSDSQGCHPMSAVLLLKERKRQRQGVDVQVPFVTPKIWKYEQYAVTGGNIPILTPILWMSEDLANMTITFLTAARQLSWLGTW